MFKIVKIYTDLIENTEFFLSSFFPGLFLMLLRKETILPVSKSVLKLLWIPLDAMVTMGFLCMGSSLWSASDVTNSALSQAGLRNE